jgi:hypothetical protein
MPVASKTTVGRSPEVICFSASRQVHAAVGFATAASDAASAIEVRFDRAAVARFDVFGRTTHRNHLDAKLATEYSRVAEKRLPSIEGMDVGAADSDAVNAHRRFVGLDRCRGPFCGEQAGGGGWSRLTEPATQSRSSISRRRIAIRDAVGDRKEVFGPTYGSSAQLRRIVRAATR